MVLFVQMVKQRYAVYNFACMDLIKRYERHISGVAFIVGFVLDYLFAPRIDNPYTPLLVGGYLALAGMSILVEQYIGRPPTEKPLAVRLAAILPTLTQFLLGALMSVLFVYYSRSAVLAGSWPFMFLLGAMFLGNEIFRDKVRLFKFQLATFFFVFYMVMVLFVPVLLGELGPTPFLIAGAVSLLGFFLFIGIIFMLSRKLIREHALGILSLLGGMYLVLNILYFARLIPPIPLLLRDSGVYHFISRDALGNYLGIGERALGGKPGWFEDETLRLSPGEPAYFYSAVYAPIAMTTPVVHVWEYEDKEAGKWVTLHRFSFPIVGGRDGGYRGYSIKESVRTGRWRVSVETATGELLGRETFLVVRAEGAIPLEQRVLK